jgi:DNA-binding MarR family transcriptional regulator
VCFSAGMHSFAFQLKMGHLRNAAFGRKAIEDKRIKQMTPARYDLLYALRRVALGIEGSMPATGAGAVGLLQTRLTTTLGVCKSVTSRMLIQLEEMGWVTRERCLDDLRQKYVTLTKLGLRMVRKVLRRIVRGNLFRKAYDRYFWARKSEVHPWVKAAAEAAARTRARQARRDARAGGDAVDEAMAAAARATPEGIAKARAEAEAEAKAKAEATAKAEAEAKAAARPPPKHVRERMYRMWLQLESLAKHFQDKSTLQYDYGYVIE